MPASTRLVIAIAGDRNAAGSAGGSIMATVFTVHMTNIDAAFSGDPAASPGIDMAAIPRISAPRSEILAALRAHSLDDVSRAVR